MNVKKIKEIATPILKRHGLARAFVFGSYARGEQDEKSDVDILIEYAPGGRKSLLTRVKITNELKEALQKDCGRSNGILPVTFFRNDIPSGYA